MVNDRSEELSAIIDGEADSDQTRRLVDALLEDSELRRQWARHHLISDTLQNEIPPRIDSDFAGRVASALADEPTILAPRRRGVTVAGWARRIAGGAIAASVAVVAIMAIQPATPPGEQMAKAPTEQEYIRLAGQQAKPVTSARDDAPQAARQVEQKKMLEYYLVNHNEYSATAGQGVLPYARIVSHPVGR